MVAPNDRAQAWVLLKVSVGHLVSSPVMKYRQSHSNSRTMLLLISYSVPKPKATEAVNALLEGMKDALLRGDRIELRGLRVMTRCGALPEERDRAQPFELDIDIHLDLTGPGASDDLADTVELGEAKAEAELDEVARHGALTGQHQIALACHR